MIKNIIFYPIKKTKNGYYGKCFSDKNIQNVIIKNNLNLNQTYYLITNFSEIEETYTVTEYYEYIVLIGNITNIKTIKTSKYSLINFKTEEGLIYKANVITSDMERDKKNILKGYINDKGIIECLSLKPLIYLKLEIKKDVNVFKYEGKLDKIVSSAKCEILDSFNKNIISGKKENIFIKSNLSNLCLLYKGDEITAYGYLENKYFNVLSYEKNTSDSLKMMDVYFKNITKGLLTDKNRKSLFDLYGLETLEKLKNKDNHDKILEDYKLAYKKSFPMDTKTKECKLEKIRSCINTSIYLQEFFFFCEKEGISSRVASYIFNEFKDRAIIELKRNPYQIINNNYDYFEEADIIAKRFGFASDNEYRIKAIILSFLNNDCEKGNVYTNKDYFLDNISDYLNRFNIYENISIPLTILNQCLNDLQNDEKIVINKDMIYLTYNYFYEKQSAKLLISLINDFKIPFCNKLKIEDSIKEFEKKIKLADEQKESIYNALLNNVSILTGGPGTGKTLTVSAIISAIKNIRPFAKIKLCAPTGRASKRMNEVSGYPASTIHKLLNIGIYSEINDEKSEELEDVDFLIIDEFSMVDLKLFYLILLNLDEKTRLIIVGDYHQLSSVGVGQVMKDLILSKKIPTVELTKIFRQKGTSDIVNLAHDMIYKGKGKINLNKYLFDFNNSMDLLNDDKNLYFINSTNENEIIDNLYKTLDIYFENGYNFEKIQILNATNKFNIGSNYLNKMIQKNYNKKDNGMDIYKLSDYNSFNVNDKIIQTINDYDSMVMNGTIGYINKTNLDSLIIDFKDDDAIKEYEYEKILNIQLAYSISIHKSQGSEYPIVILPFSYLQKNMLNLNLLYTGITRAKCKLVLIGDYNLFLESLTKTETNRNSNLCNLLL